MLTGLCLLAINPCLVLSCISPSTVLLTFGHACNACLLYGQCRVGCYMLRGGFTQVGHRMH